MGGRIKILRVLKAGIVLAFLTAPSWAFDKGYDFRASPGFVTDPANSTYVLDTDIYPLVTRNGNTFGWILGNDPNTLGGGGRDRDSGIDPRLAGMNFCGNQIASATWRLDGLTPGVYTFTIGYGDAGGNSSNDYLSIQNLDGSFVVGPLHVTTASTPTFGDAATNTWTASAWPGSQVTVTGTVTGTSINLWMGSGLTTDGTNSVIDTLFIHQGTASTGTVPQSTWMIFQ